MTEVKYNRIGEGYDQTRKADPYLCSRMAEHLGKAANRLFLDIGCGTGNYTSCLHTKGFNFVAIDPSETMLEEAKLRNDEIDWRHGNAEDTGLADASVDGILASLTLHHWSDLNHGFREMQRVLKEGDHMVIFTSDPEQMKGYWLNHYFPAMLKASIEQMPAADRIVQIMKGCGFQIVDREKYFVRPDLEDKFLYSGKHRPELYLKPEIRRGISSFSDLAHRDEVERGLQSLEKDIISGLINEIIKDYENDQGDYLFIVGQKIVEE